MLFTHRVMSEVFPTDCSPRKTSLNFLSGLPKSLAVIFAWADFFLFFQRGRHLGSENLEINSENSGRVSFQMTLGLCFDELARPPANHSAGWMKRANRLANQRPPSSKTFPDSESQTGDSPERENNLKVNENHIFTDPKGQNALIRQRNAG